MIEASNFLVHEKIGWYPILPMIGDALNVIRKIVVGKRYKGQFVRATRDNNFCGSHHISSFCGVHGAHEKWHLLL